MKREISGAGHRAGVETGDLVTVLVCADEEGGGEQVGFVADERGIYPMLLQPGAVLAEVLSHGAHHARALAQERQVVGDVGRTPAPLPSHLVHQKTDGEVLDLVGQDVLGEAAREGHQVVIGDRTGDDDVHFPS